MKPGANSRHCVSFGVQFQLTADSDFALAQMLAKAPFDTQVCTFPFAGAQRFTLASREGPGYYLAVDDEMVAESAEWRTVLDQFAQGLMVHVANYAPDRVFMHAGVVGWQGNALVFPGTSFAGKTTLVAELVRAGAIYYSDEYAVLDEEGRVHPYPRDLQMRKTGRTEQTAVAVGQIGGIAGTGPLLASQVIFTKYAENGGWNPEPVSKGMAVLEMLQHTIPVQRTPARVMATLAKMMDSATAIRSERGEASEVTRVLLNMSKLTL